jgi:predicted nucleotidyltransferase component of viral defense system
MNLHNDRENFSDVLTIISTQSGVREDILEKDYYVTLLLKELADKQDVLPAFFKGGTALYKALRSIRRFSEDIDLTVKTDDCSNSQAKRRLEKAAQGYISLPRTVDKELESNQKGSISCVYDYITAGDVPNNDPLQRFGHVRVEATSFTVSEPTNLLEVSPALYEFATSAQKAMLRDDYDVSPFFIETIRLERIFADKIFAAEFYYQREMYFDVAKHIYDIKIMSQLDIIHALFRNPSELSQMLNYKRKEESTRIGSDLADKAWSDFSITKDLDANEALRNDFYKMQNIYIFNDADKIEFEIACATYKNIVNEIMTGDLP